MRSVWALCMKLMQVNQVLVTNRSNLSGSVKRYCKWGRGNGGCKAPWGTLGHRRSRPRVPKPDYVQYILVN